MCGPHTGNRSLNRRRRICRAGIIRAEIRNHVPEDLVVVLIRRIHKRRLAIVLDGLVPELGRPGRQARAGGCRRSNIVVKSNRLRLIEMDPRLGGFVHDGVWDSAGGFCVR